MTLAQKSGFAGKAQKLLVLLSHRVLRQGDSALARRRSLAVTLPLVLVFHRTVAPIKYKPLKTGGRPLHFPQAMVDPLVDVDGAKKDGWRDVCDSLEERIVTGDDGIFRHGVVGSEHQGTGNADGVHD